MEASHTHHLFKSRDRITRTVGVDRRHGPFVPGRHRLQHVKGFFATYLTDDNAVGSHSECVFDEFSLANFAATFNIWRTGLKSPDMWLLQLQLGSILDRNQTLFFRNEARQGIEERCLSGPCATGDENRHSCPYGLGEHSCHRRAQGTGRYQRLHFQRTLGKLADGDKWAIDGDRPDSDVDTRPVNQPGIDHWRGFVNTAADCTDDLIDDA